MATKQKLSPLEEAFELLRKYNTTKSDIVRERIVTKLFYAGYVIRPAMMIIEHDEAHSDVLNEGSKEWTLYNRSTGKPVTPPNATWKVATDNLVVGKWALNRKLRTILTSGSLEGIGAIKRQENGLYTISKALKDEQNVLVRDVPGEQVDTRLAELNIENADWR